MELLAIKKMSVKYGNHTALDIKQEIVFSCGDRIGIIGNNGAGKSTFVKALCGLVHYKGKIETKLKLSDFAIHLQDNGYVKRMPVKFILEAALNTRIRGNEKLTNLVKYLDFEKCLNKSFGQLSGGQKQKLTTIIVLFQDREITFFDEVTSALDFETRQKLMSKINDWYRDRQNTVCVVSHYYDELETLCNKLLIIENGQVVDFDGIDSLFKKYCGQAVITLQNNETNCELTKQFKHLHAPEHLIALSCDDTESERKIAEILSNNRVNYKRSNKEIEILFVNAVKKFKEKQK